MSSNATGASAASAALRNSGVESPEGEEGDQGDGVNNELILRYKWTDIVINCSSNKSQSSATSHSEQIWSSTVGVIRSSHQVQSSGTLVINLMVLGYTSNQTASSEEPRVANE